ncbi:MAG: hypothetical protein KAQ96_11115, partial [Thermoplasmata archaeon]|nr:hypothetical protein [Thermoplasmata archaeon]
SSYRIEFPFEDYYYKLEESYFLDVTDDPRSAIDPAPLDVVITWRPPYGYPTSIADYGQIQLNVNRNVLTYRIWPDLQGLLPFYIDDWPWELDDWKGGRW